MLWCYDGADYSLHQNASVALISTALSELSARIGEKIRLKPVPKRLDFGFVNSNLLLCEIWVAKLLRNRLDGIDFCGWIRLIGMWQPGRCWRCVDCFQVPLMPAWKYVPTTNDYYYTGQCDAVARIYRTWLYDGFLIEFYSVQTIQSNCTRYDILNHLQLTLEGGWFGRAVRSSLVSSYQRQFQTDGLHCSFQLIVLVNRALVHRQRHPLAVAATKMATVNIESGRWGKPETPATHL